MITSAEINALPPVIKRWSRAPKARGGRDFGDHASKNPFLTVRFPPALWKQLQTFQDEAGLAVGEIVRRLMVKGMK